MTQYKVYVHQAGRVERREAFAALDDAAAIRRMDAHIGALAVELWRGGRLVKALPARG